MPSPEQQTPSNNNAPISRREAVLRSTVAMLGFASAATLLGGCSSGSSSGRDAFSGGPTSVPPADRRSTDELLSRWGNGSASRRPSEARAGDWQPLPDSGFRGDAPPFAGLVRRANWSKGNPVPNLMDRMLPIDKVTIHHDGMSTFTSTSQAAAAARIESIRRAHRGRNWGDIGYHFLIDPSGRVWEGRPLAWQGAHVKDNNEGNIGICMLGNYEEQAVSPAQANALDQFLATTVRSYRISRARVYTHQEFNPTACPGRSLQARMDTIRTSRNSALASL